MLHESTWSRSPDNIQHRSIDPAKIDPITSMSQSRHIYCPVWTIPNRAVCHATTHHVIDSNLGKTSAILPRDRV
jgi:hypothetical protein